MRASNTRSSGTFLSKKRRSPPVVIVIVVVVENRQYIRRKNGGVINEYVHGKSSDVVKNKLSRVREDDGEPVSGFGWLYPSHAVWVGKP
jgi:hypothetical protein